MSKLGKRYFAIQQLSFVALGIDTMAEYGRLIVKRPLLLFGTMFWSVLHCLAIMHYAYVHIKNYTEVTDSMSLLLESLLSMWKMIIFLSKRNEIVQFIKRIHVLNLKANQDEFSIIQSENAKDFLTCSIYFTGVWGTTAVGVLYPILNAFRVYFQSGVLDLRAPHKATYFWNYSHLSGYSIVYLWNCLSLYFVAFTSLAVDSLFSWLSCNIIAQFRILFYRLHKTASIIAATEADDKCSTNRKLQLIIACIQHHRRTLQLAERLNHVYSKIIFIKFIIDCSEICCLAFRITRSNGSIDVVIHDGLFLSSKSLQLMVYCYNGQRIKDISMLVASKFYIIFEWYQMARPCRNLLLLPMMRSYKSCQLNGVFFIVDLGLYLWVFKTAGSLIAALSALEQNQD